MPLTGDVRAGSATPTHPRGRSWQAPRPRLQDPNPPAGPPGRCGDRLVSRAGGCPKASGTGSSRVQDRWARRRLSSQTPPFPRSCLSPRLRAEMGEEAQRPPAAACGSRGHKGKRVNRCPIRAVMTDFDHQMASNAHLCPQQQNYISTAAENKTGSHLSIIRRVQNTIADALMSSCSLHDHPRRRQLSFRR